MPIDVDNESRKKIRENVNNNYFVEAGAGSGKTSVLVDRMVSMVEQGFDISKICTITFTKTAANEFYDRFQSKLSESKSENAKKALKNIDLCFMGTIDAFCNMVLSEHPLEAKIPSDATVCDEDDLEKYVLKAYSNIQKDETNKELFDKCREFKKYFWNDSAVFCEGIIPLLKTRNAHFNYKMPENFIVDEVLKEEREKLIPIFTYLSEHKEAMYDRDDKSRKAWASLEEDLNILKKSWNNSLDFVRKTLMSLRYLRITKEYESKMNELGPGWDSIFFPIVTPKGAIARYEVDSEGDVLGLNKINNYITAFALDFISASVEPVAQALIKDGILSFADCLLLLRNMLKEDAATGGKLIKHIYNRHSYFLIDEFQDTDPIQSEVFFYLTAKKLDLDPLKCIPYPGSLFIVGDPKQSIYRFKNADVSSFIRIRTVFENPDVGEVLYLARNFRSTDLMCSWFNKVFTKLLDEDTAIQSKYNEIPTGEKPEYKASLNGAYYYSVQYAQKTVDNEDYARVADIIRRIQESETITIQDRGDKSQPRKAEYKDFMVITPQKNSLAMFAKAMLDCGIPFKVEGKIVLSECPALVAISRVFNAVADPFDKGAVFAAEKLSGCSVNEEILHEYHNAAKTKSASALFSTMVDELNPFASVGIANAEYLYFVIELLRSAEIARAVTSVKEAASYINDLLEVGPERCMQFIQSANRVLLANLHKVKGLEAPVVILANPRKREFGASFRVDYSENPPQSYLFELDKKKITYYEKEKQLEEEVLESESIRLLYVAATRASNALIIANLIDKDGNSKDNVWTRLLQFATQNIYSTLGEYKPAKFKPKPFNVVADLIEEADKISKLKNVSSCKNGSYTIMRPSMIKLNSIDKPEEEYDQETAEELKKSNKKNAALIGTIVHRLMEIFVLSKGKVVLSDTVDTIAKEYGIDDPYYKGILQNVGLTIKQGGFAQATDVPKDILNELLSADEVYCELPFCYKDADIVWNGVIDAVYLKEGKWHIIDYKTNAEADDLDAKYQNQLQAYIKAFKEMTGNDADALIYHIDV